MKRRKSINLPISLTLEMGEYMKEFPPLDLMTEIDDVMGTKHRQFEFSGKTLILNYTDQTGNAIVAYYKANETRVDENTYLVEWNLLGIAKDGAQLAVKPELLRGRNQAGGCTLSQIPPSNMN